MEVCLKYSLVLLFLIMSHVHASPSCLPEISIDDFKTQLQNVREEFFPELAHEKIEVVTFRSDAYFLQAQPEAKSLFGKKVKRKYNIRLNLKLLECPPDKDSLEAILVHELEHVKDYTGWSAKKMISHGIKYVKSLQFKADYEHATDRKVLEKRLNIGLAGYRVWVYDKLDPKDYEKKRFIYLTPEEILGH